MSEFKAWPKTPRLNRNCIATEKIDGTNCAIIISKPENLDDFKAAAETCTAEVGEYLIHCQSRKRIIQPNTAENKAADNFGFAGWVAENCENGILDLGEGYHYGEWWGSGIQRSYGQPASVKHFSLFNAGRWHDQFANGVGEDIVPSCCRVVPVLATGTQINEVAEAGMDLLREHGSFAAPFDNPEGVVVYHTAARQSFKVTVEGDESPKGIYKGMHSA